MKTHPLPGLIVTRVLATAALVSAALCCAACLQELPLGDKYINEAAGFLRVRNTSTQASYIITAFELRDSSGKTVRTWEGLALVPGETWTGDVDQEGSFTLYCTVYNRDEKTTGTFNHGPVAIKLHEVTDSGITGEVYLSTTDTDGDGFSDFWEMAHAEEGFNWEDPSDGGMVYVSPAGNNGMGTEGRPYFSLAKGVWKAKYGLTDDARTVVVTGTLDRGIEGAKDTDTSVFSITDTGLRGVTIVGGNSQSVLDGKETQLNPGKKRVLYLGPGTKLTLKNITITTGVGYRGGGIHAKGAALTLGAGAVIEKCASQAGSLSSGGLYAVDGASVVMESGSYIRDNTGSVGAAVTLLNGSSLTMQGGSLITDNLGDRGGVVEADLRSQITLEPGAEITGNTNSNILNPKISHGGGVRLTGGSTLLMKGGRIAGNTLVEDSSGGGGVYVGLESVFEMRGGEISGNIVGKVAEGANPAVEGNGGGVYVDSGGVFRMTGGVIAHNTANAGNGGGVYVDKGNFYKTGGDVYGSGNNTAESGHAFYGEPGQPINNTLPVSFNF